MLFIPISTSVICYLCQLSTTPFFVTPPPPATSTTPQASFTYANRHIPYNKYIALWFFNFFYLKYFVSHSLGWYIVTPGSQWDRF
jgi:hypothetical protein